MAVKPSPRDVLALLTKPSWRGIPFEVGPNDFEFDHAHAQHLYPDRDAGYIEATGRNPARYKFTALFRNGIAGVGAWALYPDRWRAFIGACLDRSSGKLVHPELGELTAKCARCRSAWQPEARDGCDVEVEFVECSDTEKELADILSGQSPAAAAMAIATDIDNALGTINPEPEVPAALKPTLLQTIQRLNGLLTQVRLTAGNLQARADQVRGALDQLHDTLAKRDNPADFALLTSVRGLGVHVADMQTARLAKRRPVTQVLVKQTAPIPAVASAFGQSIEEFLTLNPALGARTRVAAGQLVFVVA